MHQRLVERAAALEVRDQAGDGLVHFRGMHAVVVHDAGMGVPRIHVLIDDGPAVELDEAYAPFDQPPRQQALFAERLGHGIV